MFTSLLVTPEQAALRAGVRRFLAEQEPIETARASTETGTRKPATWQRMAEEIGVGYLLLPEDAGGLGEALVELTLVAEEGGYQLLTAPLLASVLSARVLARSGLKDPEVWQPLGDGSKVIAPVLAGSPGTWSPESVTVTASDGRLSGRCEFVVDDATADWLLVAALSQSGVSLFLVDGDAAGVARAVVDTLDRTRRLSTVEFEGALGRELNLSETSAGAISAAYDEALVVLAAEQVGVAQRALDLAVDYVKTREQFGRPVGSFQAVKHLLADALVAVESARSSVTVAAHATGELGSRASLTLARCSQVAVKVTAASIQAHGGIGYTWEHNAHLLLKRARANSLLLGSPSTHRRRVLNSMGA